MHWYALSTFISPRLNPLCNVGKAPSRLKVVERAKYDAWKELGSMTKEEARKTYVQELTKAWPQWTTPKPKL